MSPTRVNLKCIVQMVSHPRASWTSTGIITEVTLTGGKLNLKSHNMSKDHHEGET